MKKAFSLIVFVFMVAGATVKAQTNFINQLQTEIEGQGIISVDQDPRLTQIADAEELIPSTIATSKATSIATESKVKQDAEGPGARAAGLHQKVRGYRVQVYFGGNLRSDQTKAQQVGTKVQSQFPELRAYTSFESPHWRCRVGDFTTHEDAAAYLRKLKARGFNEAMVVKSEIYVSRDQLR